MRKFVSLAIALILAFVCLKTCVKVTSSLFSGQKKTEASQQEDPVRVDPFSPPPEYFQPVTQQELDKAFASNDKPAQAYKKVAKSLPVKPVQKKNAQLSHENYEQLNNQCALAIFQKEYQQAKGFCQRATQMKPGDNSAYYNLALLYSKLNDYKKAAQSQKKAIELDKKPEPSSYQKLVKYYELAGDKKQAQKYLSKVKS